MKTEAEEQTHCYHYKSDIQAGIATAGFIHGLEVMEREPSGSPLSCPHQLPLQNSLWYRGHLG